jgi:dsRNA-specific ribonuclease
MMNEEKYKKFLQDVEDKLTPFHAPRGEEFKSFIKSVLTQSKLKEHYIDILLNDESLKIYSDAFTSSTIQSYRKDVIKNGKEKIEVHVNENSTENYEIYEKLGDGIIHNFIGWYVFRRFPELRSVKDVRIFAIIKIKYGGKEQLAPMAEKYGFWPFISSSMYQRKNEKKALLEDTFEAFLGATSYILDTNLINGVGYSICYNLLETIFDQIEISKDFEKQLDNKTKLKEMFDQKKVEGVLKYAEPEYNEETRQQKVIIYRVVGGREIKLSEGTGSKKILAQQNAAENALKYLKSIGIE